MNDRIENNFSWHKPQPEQSEKYAALRAKAKELAYLIDVSCPDTRERAKAMSKLEECLFWANASIARQSPISIHSGEKARAAAAVPPPDEG